jgi:hypothetical protein
MTQMLTDRYHERLAGTLSCYDRIVITGTLPGACYAAGMTSFLNAKHIRIFDYPRFAEPLRDRIREAAQVLATAQGARSKKITPQLAQELGSRFTTRIEGTCIKHHFGKVSLKMYDKFNRVLRLETTTNNVSFFKHHRKVEHRDGHESREIAPLRKTIYSLIDLREILLGCNRRYLE